LAASTAVGGLPVVEKISRLGLENTIGRGTDLPILDERERTFGKELWMRRNTTNDTSLRRRSTRPLEDVALSTDG
jgi:hypothetical protein